MKEICTLMVKLHIVFFRMQRVNQHARPSIIQVGCPTCCYQVCALDHANGGAADMDYGSEHCHRNEYFFSGQALISSDLHVVWIFPDMSDGQTCCRT